MAGVGVFLALFVGIGAKLEDARYQFSPNFDKLLQIYLDVIKFVLTMAAGGNARNSVESRGSRLTHFTMPSVAWQLLT